MNNIEIEYLKKNLKEHLNYTDEEIKEAFKMNDRKMNALKREIDKLVNKNEKTSRELYQKNLIRKKINDIFERNPKLKNNVLINDLPKKAKNSNNVIDNTSNNVIDDIVIDDIVIEEVQKVNININKKPKILFISDVKGWAWWIKSHYLKKYLSEYFDIDVKHLIGPGATPYSNINQNKYDLYFTYGYSYIDFLDKVSRNKKVTGITAHRQRNMIFPKMKLAGNQHANSIMLLKELHDMGFKKAFYIPNGVDEKLFKPINDIKKDGELIIGHVGKECEAKGQKEYILPAIKTVGAKSFTNLRTWKDKLPHDEMPSIYNKMDVFVVASVEDGTPNPALEAAACGRPIISNAIGNMPEFIKDGYNGFIVPRNIGAYVDKLRYFKNNRNELIRMGNNARKTIEEGWSWKLMSRNYLKMFDTIFGIVRDQSLYENPALYH